MSCLLRQSYPYLVLLGTFRRQEGKDCNNNENHHHAKLHIGIGGQAFQHQRLVITHQLIIVALSSVPSKINTDISTCLSHPFSLFSDHPYRIGSITFLNVKITIVHHLSLCIKHNHWYRIITLNNTQSQRQVCRLICIIQCVECLNPNLHLIPFLLL